MADGTNIEWTDATWNVINGCSVTSPGCTHCYAMKLAGTRLRNHPSRAGLTVDSKAGPVWTGDVRFNDRVLTDPLRWRRPRRIFVCAHGDLFHENVPDEWIDRVFAVMALAPQHQFQVLTKRADRMRAYMTHHLTGFIRREMQAIRRQAIVEMVWPLPNIWLGVSVEDQQRANERIPDLMATPAAVRWLSCEPLLDFISLEEAWHDESALDSECWGECGWCTAGHPPMWNCRRDGGKQYEPGASQRSGLDWIVVGGESGPKARPMELEAARSLRDQCAGAGVPFFFKQWGAHVPCGQMLADGRIWTNGSNHSLLTTKTFAGRYLDGAIHEGMPA